jgi:hypothetical protein
MLYQLVLVILQLKCLLMTSNYSIYNSANGVSDLQQALDTCLVV